MAVLEKTTMNSKQTDTPPCLLDSWHSLESDLYHWLLKRSNNPDLSFDVLQETFLKALQLQNDFCHIEHPKAWVFRVAHNLLIDWHRKQGKFVDWQETFEHQENKIASTITEASLLEHSDDCQPLWGSESSPPPVDSLAQCLPKALLKLSPSEREIIEACDLNGVKQAEFAKQQLSLAATKARLKRARKKLKLVLKKQCCIQFDEQQKVCCFFPS